MSANHTKPKEKHVNLWPLPTPMILEILVLPRHIVAG
jgi:hypothetical protein